MCVCVYRALYIYIYIYIRKVLLFLSPGVLMYLFQFIFSYSCFYLIFFFPQTIPEICYKINFGFYFFIKFHKFAKKLSHSFFFLSLSLWQDMVVYSVFAFLYLVGASLVASAFDFYEKMQVGVGHQTIQQLILSVVSHLLLFIS